MSAQGWYDWANHLEHSTSKDSTELTKNRRTYRSQAHVHPTFGRTSLPSKQTDVEEIIAVAVEAIRSYSTHEIAQHLAGRHVYERQRRGT